MALYRDPYARLRALSGNSLVPDSVANEDVLSPEELERESRRAQYGARSDFENSVQQGMQDIKASGLAARGLLRIGVGDDAGGTNDLLRSREVTDRADEFGNKVDSLEEIGGVGDAFSYAGNTLGRLAPTIALSVGTGLVGGAAKVGVNTLARGAVNRLGREVTEDVANRALVPTVARGGLRREAGQELVPNPDAGRQLTPFAPPAAPAGAAARRTPVDIAAEFKKGSERAAVAAGIVQQSALAPDVVLDPEGKGSLRERALVAGAGAVVTGALDALPIIGLLKRYGINAGDTPISGKLVERIAKNAAQQGASEGATELAQTFGERLTHKFVNDNIELVGPDAYSEYLNAAAAGFIGGGAFGAPGGLRGQQRDSDAGKKYAAEYKDYVGRLRLTSDGGKALAEAPIEGEFTDVTPDPDVAFDASDILDTLKGAAAGAKDLGKDLGTKAKEVTDDFKKRLNDLWGDSETENSIDEVLNATPYNYKPVSEDQGVAGGVMFNDGGGVNAAKAIIPAGRVRELREQFPDMDMFTASAMAMVPDVLKAGQLNQSGAIAEAARMLQGEDPKNIDNKLISEFQDSLPPENRNAFNRAAMTIWKTKQDQVDVELAPEGVEAQVDEDFQQQETMTEQQPLPAVDKRVDEWRSKGGKPITGMPKDALVVVDADGNRRAIPGQTLGRMMIETRNEDADFKSAPQLSQVAQLLGDFHRKGFKIEPASLRAMALGKGWMLTEQDAVALRNGLAPAAPKKAGPATKGSPAARTKTKTEEQALNAEMGRAGGVDVQKIENEQEIDKQHVLAPRGGAPRLAPQVSKEGRVTEAQAIDSGAIDTEAQRAESEPDDFNALDSLIERHTGAKVNGDFDARRALYAQVLKEGKRDFVDVKAKLDPATGKIDRRGKERRVPLSKQEREELIDAAGRFAEANRAAALKRVRSANNKVQAAQRRWQHHKTPETFAEFKAARKKLAKAQERYDEATELLEKKGKPVVAARSPTGEQMDRRQAKIGDVAAKDGSQPLPGPTPLEREGQRQRREREKQTGEEVGEAIAKLLGPDSVVENSASEDAFGAQLDGAVRSRSRRHLYAMKDRIAKSKLSDAKKEALLKRVNEEIAKLRETIHATAESDLSANNRRTVRMDNFRAVRDAVAKESTLEGALKAAREHATPPQKALIDILLKLGAVKGVAFTAINNPSQRSGTVNGAHTSGSRSGTTLNSRVSLSFGSDSGVAATDSVATLLHEAIHAATAHAEQTNGKARRELGKLLESVRAEAIKRGYDPDTFYGLSETQEFLAEAFTNEELQNLLRSIPMPNDADRSMWDAFKDWVASQLGVQTGAQRTALDAVMESGLDLAQRTATDRRAAYESIFTEEHPEQNVHGASATPASGSGPADYMSMLGANERRYLEGAFRRAEVLRQVKAALPPDQHARLMSADEGPTLLVNTALALAMQGRLDLNHNPSTLKGAVQGLWEIISKVLQIPSKTAYARAVMESLASGTPAARIDAQALLLRPSALKVTRYIQTNVQPKAKALLQDMDSRLRKSGVPALTQLATLLAQRTGEFRADGKGSYSASVLAERNKRMNALFSVIEGWDAAKKTRVLKELQTNTATPSAEATQLRDYLRDMHAYATGAGVQMGNIKDYFPVSMDPDLVAANQQEFLDLMGAPEFAAELRTRNLTPADLFAAASSWNRFSQVGDTTFADGEHDPNFRAKNPRLMDFVFKHGTPEQIAKLQTFQDQNLERVMVQYTTRAVRRAEWERLGMGPQIKSLLAKAAQQGATPEQLTMSKDYIDMVMGVYGHDWNPMIKRIADSLGVHLPDYGKFQKIQGALTTYQNLRLLPLAAMSSLIDPLGVAVRSGGMKGSFDSYRDAVRAIRDKSGNDALMALAQSMGIVERHAVSEALAHMYGSVNDPTGTAAKLNNALFRFNGLSYITKFSRLAALAAGNNFIKTHAASNTEQSKRYLTELGLTPADVQTGADGYVIRNDKIDAALNRFVNESVVRPTAGQRPGWQNDPNFQMAAQYKGYLYSFFNTVTRRAMHELEHGNGSVLLPLLMYLPVTAAGEMLRDMLQGDDEERDMLDYSKLAIARSGLLGPHIGTFNDFQSSPSKIALNAIAGPTGSQLGDAYKVAIGERDAGGAIEAAMPASTLYKDWE